MTTMGNVLAQQTWLDPLAERLGRAVAAAFSSGGEAGRRVKDALNGVWLGHPLHPVLTDIPIGAWSMAAIFDALDSARPHETHRQAASVCVDVGLVAAGATAASGLADWVDTNAGSRRIGLVHGLLNLTATGLYLSSSILRHRRHSQAARAYAHLGYAVVMASAYLGGDLVYDRQLGVNHAAEFSLPDSYERVMPAAGLVEGTPRRVTIGEVPVLLVRRGERVHALAERCAHQGGPLSEGTFDETTVTCPWHGSQFVLENGAIVHGPTTFRQPCFEARINEGWLEVRGQG